MLAFMLAIQADDDFRQTDAGETLRLFLALGPFDHNCVEAAFLV